MTTICSMLRSRLALANGDGKQALAFAEQALASVRDEHSEDPIGDRYRVALTYLLLGDVQKSGGDGEAATAAWNAGLGQLPRGAAEWPLQMSEHAELLQRLGRSAEAAPIVERLNRMGYRSII